MKDVTKLIYSLVSKEFVPLKQLTKCSAFKSWAICSSEFVEEYQNYDWKSEFYITTLRLLKNYFE